MPNFAPDSLPAVALLPSCVRFVHRRKDCAEIDAFVGCEVDFGADADDVVFPRTAQQMPILAADPHLRRLSIRLARRPARTGPRISRPTSVRICKKQSGTGGKKVTTLS